MAKISNFPDALQPIIAQGLLVREFESSIKYYHSFRSCADRVTTDANVPLYSAQPPVSMVTSRIGVASQFLLNAAMNGMNTIHKIHTLAEKALNTASHPVDISGVLTLNAVRDAVDILRKNAIPDIDGYYNCYLNPTASLQLLSDKEYQDFFNPPFHHISRRGMINTFIGIRFIPILSLEGEKSIRRTFICGQGALIESVPDDLIKASKINDSDTLIDVIDGSLMLTREPIDRLQQIITQSWAYMGEFTARPDRFVTIETQVSA